MKESFLNKYKPKFLSDFYLSTECNNLIQTLFKMNNLNILFIGCAGTGKTSIIQAIVREYYNINKIYNENILHINCLKEQGIQYYRNNLKTFCQTKSTIPNKKKIIILDDFDMINEQSQQVFRNYIDKYSHNIHYLISCKNNQKVIDNIQSRNVIIKLNKISPEKFNLFFLKIIKNENIKITNNAKKFILKISDLNFNKLLNNLEKMKLYNKKITNNNIKEICTNINFIIFQKYTEFWIKKDYKNAIKTIIEVYNKGFSVIDILADYFSFIKVTTILNEKDKYKTIKFICKYIKNFYINHEDEIELVFFTNNLIINLSKID
tara:strand:- start:25557 stop:26519 length:963 start_codon:yes stop_codon:yes gene_type:complete